MIDTLVPDALEYFDKSVDKLKDIVENYVIHLHMPGLGHENLSQTAYCDITSKKTNKKISISYQIISYYAKNEELWIWGWAHPVSRPIDITQSLKILNYGVNLNTADEIGLKTIIINSRSILSELETDIQLGLVAYITKNNYIIGYKALNNVLKNFIIYIQLNKDEMDKYIFNE